MAEEIHQESVLTDEEAEILDSLTDEQTAVIVGAKLIASLRAITNVIAGAIEHGDLLLGHSMLQLLHGMVGVEGGKPTSHLDDMLFASIPFSSETLTQVMSSMLMADATTVRSNAVEALRAAGVDSWKELLHAFAGPSAP
jgi:hypothetical protein